MYGSSTMLEISQKLGEPTQVLTHGLLVLVEKIVFLILKDCKRKMKYFICKIRNSDSKLSHLILKLLRIRHSRLIVKFFFFLVKGKVFLVKLAITQVEN